MVLRNVVPRQGTEMENSRREVKKSVEELRNVVPRQGTEITVALIFMNPKVERN